MTDEISTVCALLHDVIEDTEYTFEDNRVDFCDDCMTYNFGIAKREEPLVASKTVEKIRKYNDLRI